MIFEIFFFVIRCIKKELLSQFAIQRCIGGLGFCTMMCNSFVFTINNLSAGLQT